MAGAHVVGVVYGSPPRVRSRRCGSYYSRPCRGITSACAEQTVVCHCNHLPVWDHLRVCGADHVNHLPMLCGVGSPPRVRSRPIIEDVRLSPRRITSACAEQTIISRCCVVCCGDHLRVCGADMILSVHVQSWSGSPPRVRSRRRGQSQPSAAPRITSACAEQTAAGLGGSGRSRDHLRVCGADGVVPMIADLAEGSPPRVRSRRVAGVHGVGRVGITSACAEQT